MTYACLVFGCGDPVTTRGRCAKHARLVDVARSVGTDREAGRALYGTKRWRELRALELGLRMWCECPDCVAGQRRERSRVLHHLRPHGGDPRLFFDPSNLQALAKRCHDRITAEVRGGSLFAGSTVEKTARACPSSGRESGLGGSRRQEGASRG